jgi:citrate lyase subunit beta/citryl-CoA lyase
MLGRAVQRDADGLILNLEDAVSPEHKDIARDAVVRFLRSENSGPAEIIVRINPLDTDIGYRDLLAVVPARPQAILLPKVRDAEPVRFAAWMMERMESLYQQPSDRTMLMCMIESAAGVLNAPSIAIAHPRVKALIFGAADYGEDVGCQVANGREALMYPLTQVVLAARAAGIAAIDAPHMRPGDSVGLRADAVQARRLGYDGKSAIHPSQIAILNEVFSPDAAEIAWAQDVISRLEANDGEPIHGADLLNGELIEAPHLYRARRILHRVEQIDSLRPSKR